MKGKKLRLITEILAILVICLVSFVGVYKQNMNQMQNQVKGYDLSKDLKGYRELIFELSDATEVLNSEGKVVGSTDDYSDSSIESNSYKKTETKINADEDLKTENYQKAKSIIETRLKSLGVEDYNIGLDTQNGTIYLQIPEDDTTDHTVSNILQVAKFEIKDSEDTSKVYITNDEVKNISAVYNTTTSGTTVYLQIEFNKNGKNTLKELSTGEYATKEEDKTDNNEESNNNQSTENENNTVDENAVEGELNVSTNETTDNSSSENSDTSENKDSTSEKEDTQNKIILSIDSNDMITTSFDTPIEDGIIDLSMNQATTDTDSISDTLQSASTIALLVNSGKMPLTYKVSQNNYINTDISEVIIQKVIYVVAIIAIIALVVLVIKYRLRGLIAGIAYVGFIAIDLLLIRYTNVSITIESIVAAVIVLAINYIVTYRLVKINEADVELKKIAYSNELKSTIMKVLPIFIIAIIFVFVKWTKISTFGMFMFWGVLLCIIYNYLLTKDMLEK